MPTCPRCALVAIVLAVAAFTGCDSSNPGRDLNIVDGSYAVTSITFDPDGTAIDPVDVAAGLKKRAVHLALEDIRDSIDELRYYREHFLLVE